MFNPPATPEPVPGGPRFGRRSLVRPALALGAAGLAGAAIPACGFGRPGARHVNDGSAAAEVTGSFDWRKHAGQTVRLLMNTHPYTDALRAHADEFEQLTGIQLAIDEFPESNYFDKLTLELKSGQGNYDAFMLGAYMVWQYGPPGYLENLNPWINTSAATHAEFDPDDFYPNLLTAGQWDFVAGSELGGDQQWMLPWGFETNVICYRSDVFDTLGLRPAESFDELVELAEVITQRAPDAGFDNMYGIAVRGSREWATIHPGFMTMYAREGLVDFEVDDGYLIPRMNDAGSVEFAAKWADMARASGPAGWTSYTWYQASNDLGSGRAAMLFDADIASYFQNEDTAAAGKLAWHRGPSGPGGELDTNLWIWSLGMNAASQRKPATWWFLQWATSKDHLLWAATEQQHIDAVRASVAESPEYADRLAQAPGFLDTFDEVVEHCQIQFTPQRHFFDATTSWAAALQEIYGGADPQSTLDDLVDELEPRIQTES